MEKAMKDVAGQIFVFIIFWIIIFIIIYYKNIYESDEEKIKKQNNIKKNENDKKIKEQKEIESKNNILKLEELVKKFEISSYLNLKIKVDNLDDTEIVVFMNQNINKYNNWIKLEKEVSNKNYFETSKYIIIDEFHKTSDSLTRKLKNKETGVILKKWYYSWD
jgi:hypothetical protein